MAFFLSANLFKCEANNRKRLSFNLFIILYTLQSCIYQRGWSVCQFSRYARKRYSTCSLQLKVDIRGKMICVMKWGTFVCDTCKTVTNIK